MKNQYHRPISHKNTNSPTIGQTLCSMAPFMLPMLFILLLLAVLHYSVPAALALFSVGLIAGGAIAWRVAFGFY